MNINDKKAVIAMPTMTAALRGESLLNSAGYFVHVIKLPAESTKKGCAYGLEVNSLFLTDAARRLENAGIRHGELLS